MMSCDVQVTAVASREEGSVKAAEEEEEEMVGVVGSRMGAELVYSAKVELPSEDEEEGKSCDV